MTDPSVPLLRAARYPHEAIGHELAPRDGKESMAFMPDGGIVALEVDRMVVEHDVVDAGTVTIAASGPDRDDPYGLESDLTVEAARQVAERLCVAAEAADVRSHGSTPEPSTRGQR